MANKKVTRRSNRPFTYNPHYYSWGGDFVKSLGGKDAFNLKKAFSGANVGKMLKGGLATAAGSMIGGGASKLLSNGLESGAGSAINKVGSTLGGAISTVNPLIGAGVTAATGIISGLTNAAFGSKLNNEKIAEVENSNAAINTTKIDNSSADAIENQWASQDFGSDFSKSDIGKDGWFSSKAKKKYRQLKAQQEIARNRTLAAYSDAATAADTNTDLNAMANFAAFGGPLDMWGGGAIGYELSKEDLGIKAAKTANESKLTSLPNSFSFPELNTFAYGGDFNNGQTIIGNGGTHEENPLEGVPMGEDSEGNPNLVEQGEVIFNDYVFSNRLFANDGLLEEFGLPEKYNNHSFASIAEKLGEESKERPNDPISKKGLMSSMVRLKQAQETIREKKQSSKNGTKYAYGGLTDLISRGYQMPTEDVPEGTLFDPITNQYINTNPYVSTNITNEYRGVGITPDGNWVEEPKYMARAAAKRAGRDAGKSLDEYNANPIKLDSKKSNNSDLTSLRYAPVVGSAIGLGQNLFSRPDYSSADAVLAAANNIGNYTPVGYNPLGNYLTYKPFDRNYYLNKLNAQANATRRAIMDSSSPSRNAALLAADYNAQGKLGDLARQAEEYNLAQRQAVETFNRGTNQYNSEMGLKAAMANQDAQMRAKSGRLSGVAQAMQMRDTIDARRSASMSANLTNLFNSLGDIGREDYARNMVMTNPAYFYSINKKGEVTYKNGYDDLSEAEKAEIRRAAKEDSTSKKAKKDFPNETSETHTRAKGGYLTIKKGRRHG